MSIFTGLINSLQAKPKKAGNSHRQNLNSLNQIKLEDLVYDTFQTKVDGLIAQIEVTLNYQTVAPVASHTQLLELVIRLNQPDANGLVIAAEVPEIANIRKLFLQKIPGCIYVGSVIANGLYSSYLYLPGNIKVSDSLRTLNVPQQYSYECRLDPNWQYYTELLPTLEEGEKLINQKQLDHLKSEGLDLEATHVVRHTILADQTSMQIISDKVQQLGYQIFAIEDSVSSPGKQELIFTANTRLDVDHITAATIELAKFAHANNGSYIGWDVVEANPQPNDEIITEVPEAESPAQISNTPPVSSIEPEPVAVPAPKPPITVPIINNNPPQSLPTMMSEVDSAPKTSTPTVSTQRTALHIDASLYDKSTQSDKQQQ